MLDIAFPFESNTCNRSFPQSVTYIFPFLSTETPEGLLRLPSPEPPIVSRYCPLESNFWTLSFLQSATYTLSEISTPMPQGKLNSPLPSPAFPHSPLGQKFTFRGVFLNSVVSLVTNVHQSSGINSDTRRPIKFTFRITFDSPFTDHIAFI